MSTFADAQSGFRQRRHVDVVRRHPFDRDRTAVGIPSSSIAVDIVDCCQRGRPRVRPTPLPAAVERLASGRSNDRAHPDARSNRDLCAHRELRNVDPFGRLVGPASPATATVLELPQFATPDYGLAEMSVDLAAR